MSNLPAACNDGPSIKPAPHLVMPVARPPRRQAARDRVPAMSSAKPRKLWPKQNRSAVAPKLDATTLVPAAAGKSTSSAAARTVRSVAKINLPSQVEFVALRRTSCVQRLQSNLALRRGRSGVSEERRLSPIVGVQSLAVFLL